MTTSSRSKRRQQGQGSRPPTRRPHTSRVPEPVDYSRDYADVRRDLLRISFWTVLLLGAMFVTYFVI